MIKVAIIGGTGYENPDKLSQFKGASIETPYGMPSSDIFSGQIDGLKIIYLPRHGKDNSIPATRINYKANLYALKKLGCSIILSTSTCASLQEEICPGEFIIPDQFIDLTKNKLNSDHTDEKSDMADPQHMAKPFSEELRDHLTEAAIIQGITVHNKGTVITIDRLRYSTKAESNLYQKWGADIIDMTTSPEVIAANEIGIPYAQVSLCKAYDTWRIKEDEDQVTQDPEILQAGYKKIKQILAYAIEKIQQEE